jgi:hypothetical protein
MEINKKYFKIGIFVMFSLLFINSISSFGVGSAYHKDHPLEISPGESKEIIFNLQNMAGSSDVMVESTIEGNEEIIKLINNEKVFIPLGKEENIIAKVTIPFDAKIGDVYPIKLTFTTVTESDSGSFGFGSSVGRSFEIIVVPTLEEKARLEEKKKQIKFFIPYLLGVIILLAIVIIIWFIKKKK